MLKAVRYVIYFFQQQAQLGTSAYGARFKDLFSPELVFIAAKPSRARAMRDYFDKAQRGGQLMPRLKVRAYTAEEFVAAEHGLSLPESDAPELPRSVLRQMRSFYAEAMGSIRQARHHIRAFNQQQGTAALREPPDPPSSADVRALLFVAPEAKAGG